MVGMLKSLVVIDLRRTEWAKEEGDCPSVKNGITFCQVTDNSEANALEFL